MENADANVEQYTKNLANCTGVEFLRQTNRIRHQIEGWLKNTKVLEIRKRKATITEITADMAPEEKLKAEAQNDIARRAQARRNIDEMLDACLEKHPEETLKVLALMCFVEPAEAEQVPPTVLLANFAEMLSDEGVMRFFTSLMKWEVISTSN